MATPHSFPRTKTILALLVSISAVAFGGEIPEFKGTGEPLHPTAVTANHGGKVVPVVGVTGTKPLVDLEGKTVEAAATGFGFVRMPSYAPGLVTVRDQYVVPLKDELRDANGMVILDIPNNYPSSEYSAKLTPQLDYPAAFIVVVVFDRGFLEGGPALAPGVFFKELGPLSANETTEIKVNVGKYSEDARARLAMFPLIFVGGREVRTNIAEFPAAYFRRLELSRHGNIVANYVAKNAGADKGLQPYVRVAPIFSAADHAGTTLPPKVNVRLAVGEDGIVSQADVQGELPEGVKTELERAMRGWLFLPQLKAGKPTAIKAAVPITIGGAAP